MLREGRGNCLKHLKRGCDRKEKRGNKNFKKGGASWGKQWVLGERGGREPPYELCIQFE